jgi:ketol-acid reductoisomerase
MTIVTTGSDEVIEQITKHLNRLIEVVKVVDLTEGSYTERELMLIKVRAVGKEREEMKRMADIFRGRIIDVTEKSYTIELTGDAGKLDAFIEAHRPRGHPGNRAHRRQRHRPRRAHPARLTTPEAPSALQGGAAGYFYGERNMKVYYDKDADLSLIKGKNVTIIGYGSQGHAHAQNLNDSGVKVTVGLRKGGASWSKVEKAGLKVAEVADAVKSADVVMILLPDEQIARSTRTTSSRTSSQGASLAFAHGFNVHYGQVVPRDDLDVWMVAPKAPGHTVRNTYTQGGGVPHLIAVHAGQVRQGARPGAELRRGQRRRQGRHHRDQLPRRDRDRPVRRAGRAVRRHRRADQGGLRDAGRSRLRARDGLLRVPARAEADRRPDLRRRHRQHELLDQQQRRVRRVRDRPKIVTAETKKAMKQCLKDIQTGEYAKSFILENRPARRRC